MARRAQHESEPEEEEEEEEEDEEEEQLPIESKKVSPERLLQHTFIQALMARRTMTFKMATAIYDKAVKLTGVKNAPNLVTFVSSLEEPLALVGLAIKSRTDASTGVQTFVLVNDFADDPSKLATEYNAQEIAFFRLLVKKIMTSSNMAYCIKTKDAIALSKRAGVPTQSNGQDLMNNFVAKGWLNLSAEARLSLSHRSLSELSKYLKDTFGDDDDVPPRERAYIACASCADVVTIGWACVNEDCGVRVHDGQCAKQWLQPAKGKCRGDDPQVGCGEQWNGTQANGYTGEKVGLAESKEQFSLAANDADDRPPTSDEDEVEEDELEGTQTQTQTQKKKSLKRRAASVTGKGKGRQVSDDEDEGEDDDE
ncbi:hypothetical protein T439DRAFT_377422 [Meredithblackwellia eburnea MCA 4105]